MVNKESKQGKVYWVGFRCDADICLIRAKAQKEAAKRAGGVSQLGARAAGLQV